jgi:hypothetical protein
VGKFAFAIVLLTALSGSARADELTEAPALPPVKSMSDRMLDNLTLVSNDLALHLNTVTFNIMNVTFDIRRSMAHVRIGGGDANRVRLVVDGDIFINDDYARIDAAIQLAVAGHKLSLDLPAVDMVPRSMAGETWVEVRLPLLRGNF